MGLIQNKVTVSQPNSHVVVKNAGGLRGLTGETGPQGPQGVPGDAATVTAGTTTTLPAGSDATVQNVGSTSAAIFNFGIPKGDKGDTGESGAAATISVGTTTTLEPGEDATVTNSGTSSAAVFDFGIPKGAKGDTGSQGPAGADGFSPTATVSKTGDTATITITDKDGTTTAQISDGVTPTIDDALSPTSENPVQNKVVTNALAGKQPVFQIVDSLPAVGVEGTEYLVESVYENITELKGDTQQQSYSGKNILGGLVSTGTNNGLLTVVNADGSLSVSGTATSTYATLTAAVPINIVNGTAMTFSIKSEPSVTVGVILYNTGYANRQDMNIGTSARSVTVTTNSAKTLAVVWCTGLTANTAYDFKIEELMLEANGSATSYEPYVGGIASPNPDYPQTIQTATGLQTITVSNGQGTSQDYTVNLGKNLFDGTYVNYAIGGGSGLYRWFSASSSRSLAIPCEPNTTYTITKFTSSNRFLVADYPSMPPSGTTTDLNGLMQDNTITTGSVTVTTHSDAHYLLVCVSNDNTEPQLQIEKGSTATTYAPYFTPIELCKIGDYQDYIYKSGEDWYIHKEVGKYTILDTDVTEGANNTNVYFAAFPKQLDDLASGSWPNTQTMYLSIATFQAYSQSWNRDIYIGKFVASASGSKYWVGFPAGTSLATATTKITGGELYYALKNSTDTQITNATLISELEALNAVQIKVSSTVTVTAQDLPVILVQTEGPDSHLEPYVYYNGKFVKVQ